ncbi:MAG: penicillin-binding protein 1C [Candidatus Peregrinibacteria bacterium]
MSPSKTSIRRLLFLILFFLFFILFIFFLFTSIIPPPSSLLSPPERGTVRILDRNGALLFDAAPKDFGARRAIPLAEIPQSLKDAVIAVEDRSFYAHSGISVRGIVRAFMQNISAGRIVSGGSTITQQLVRSRLGSPERSIAGKIREAFLAYWIERHLTKNQILEAYLNSAYFGHRSYGIAAAAETFFGKSPSELSRAECALLAGLPQSPSALDPLFNLERAKDRQKTVLAALVREQKMTEEESKEAFEEPLTLAHERTEMRAPHFVQWLLSERGEAFAEGSDVRTTIDLTLQSETERIVAKQLKKLKDKNVTSAAVVVIHAKTGDVLTMVGSADYGDDTHDGQVNVALAPRQPGSTLKPFTYALALASGSTPATTVADTEAQFATAEGLPYTPRNYDYGEHGLVRYREALANSYNIAAVKVLQRVGVQRLMDFLAAAGITTLTHNAEHYGLALTLGDSEVKLLELTQAYGIFPRAGSTLPLRTLLTDPTPAGKHILDERVAWLITDILSDPSARLPQFGENGPLSFDFPAAAKTGTTRNSRDNWTIGYTEDVLVGVWVGNADNSPMRDTSGVTGAAPIFHDVLLAATALLPRKEFHMPEGIQTQTICRLSGKLPSPLCPQTIEEKFIAGTEPTEPDDIYRSFTIDTRNGFLMNKNCDRRFAQEKVFAVFPQETERWAREQGWPDPPTRLSPLCTYQNNFSSLSSSSSSSSSSWLEISHPQPLDSFRLDPLVPDSSESIIFTAQASKDIDTVVWFVDGKKAGDGTYPDFRFAWEPSLGTHTLEARAGSLTTRIQFEVVK